MATERIIPGEIRIFLNHIYEFKKGVRNMVLYTMSKEHEEFAIRLICIYIIIYQEVTFTTNRVSFYNLILYLLKNNVFSLSLYPFAFTPFTSLLPFFTILAFPSSYIQANDDAGH